MRMILLAAAVMSLLASDASHLRAAQNRINITVENFGSFDKTFNLRDGNCGNEWSATLKAWETRDYSLCTSSAGYGKLLFKKSGDNGWSESGLLSNNERVRM